MIKVSSCRILGAWKYPVTAQCVTELILSVGICEPSR